MTRTVLRRAGVLPLVWLALTACASGAVTTDAAPVSSSPTTPAPQAQPFSLHTHCGIDELIFEGRWYERVGGVLDDGQGNPPAGWGNPSQPGTLTPAGTSMVFRDQVGHEETFRLRPGATGPKNICA